ncbi:O-antigen ligase domain-containing protein [Iningainema sp. BLCCT55]|uniref:O-antigen ligase domain-containing protein n=2 Tax=Iningainema TaxID=1932705 RepID=A0A8J6XL82_9CYAN|nr:O-antigen ligase domain-containing protein [Iningainema tapete]MBD2774460.1 O-antigen ligase domain-containing protein [Iningainema tapete BLCC-T55]
MAWLAIGGLTLFTIVCYFGGAGNLLRQVFPVASFLVGVFLYARYPCLYIGYTWWVWFLIALLRRLIDFRSGWVDPSPILLAPFLVTLITFYTFIRHLPKSYRMGGLPFILSIFSVIYGFLIGLVNFSPVLVFRTMLDWLSPVLFGFHIFVNWRHYPNLRENTKTVFLWGVLLTGAYGIYQYLVAPEWDTNWLVNTKLTSFGNPAPLEIRVWSTMHSPGPFAIVIMAGLILLFSSQHPLRIPASVAGYLAFLLSMVRSAWGGWLVGLLSLLSSLKPKLQMRLVVTILVMVICVIPLTTIEPFAQVINERFQSFANLEEDQSYVDRSKNYDRNIGIALSNVLGNGIGGTWFVDKDGKLIQIVLDSGILDTFFALGWFGAIPYLGGMILLIYTLFQDSSSRSDPFANASRSIALAIVFQLIFSSLMISLSGVVLWGFLGLAMAAKKYNHHQLTM